jgi:hypothetical protein
MSRDTITVGPDATRRKMHDEEWTRRAVMGWENELDRLAKVLGK